MKISVITPVYGVEKYIEKCLRSLFEQTMTDGVEFIIVNDCTPDKSMEIARCVIKEYPCVSVKIVEHERNMGYSVVLQSGMDAATGDYTIYVDSDDWVEPDMLERMYAKAREDDADIVVCDYFVDYPRGRRVVRQPAAETGVGNIELMLKGDLGGHLWSKLVRRSLYTDNDIRTVPGVDLMEDFLLCSKLFSFAGKVSYLPQAFLHYVQRPGAMTSKKSSEKIKEIIDVVDRVEQFMRECGLSERLHGFLVYRKFLTKLVFIKNNLWRNSAEYSTVYPELTLSMLSDPPMPIHYRAVLWFASLRSRNK